MIKDDLLFTIHKVFLLNKLNFNNVHTYKNLL
jgi:hypothetical protein